MYQSVFVKEMFQRGYQQIQCQMFQREEMWRQDVRKKKKTYHLSKFSVQIQKEDLFV